MRDTSFLIFQRETCVFARTLKSPENPSVGVATQFNQDTNVEYSAFESNAAYRLSSSESVLNGRCGTVTMLTKHVLFHTIERRKCTQIGMPLVMYQSAFYSGSVVQEFTPVCFLSTVNACMR